MQSFDTDDHQPLVKQGANGFTEHLCVWSYVQLNPAADRWERRD